MNKRGLILALLCSVLLSGSAPRGRALPSDAYVWQRHWTPALADALRQGAPLVRAWRVLAAEADGAGHLRTVAVDWSVLDRPVVLVFRLDGALSREALDTIPAQVDAIMQGRKDRIAGLEIDHDCATAALPTYAHLLTTLRAQIDPNIPLSITMLPTWLGSGDLDAVLAPVTEAVLQVHAVQDPRAGLFDASQARRWVDAMARRTRKSFRIALPAYGARVSWRADGRLLAVESERPLLRGGATARELMASPIEVAALLRNLRRDPPDRLAGIVWFRLPTDDDVRAWSPATWRAVVRGDELVARTQLRAESSVTPGATELVLANEGNVDAPLPATVNLPRPCPIADGINGYALENGITLHRTEAGLLRAHQRLTIGWTHCEPELAHANP